MNKQIKKISLSFVLVLILGGCTNKFATQKDFAQYVNPLIGTDSDGHTFPGVVVPFGMVQLSPDTRTRGGDYATGYHYSDSSIIGFSHTRYSGTGRGSGGDFLFMPTTGEIQLAEGDASNTTSGYRSSFSHKNEFALPGYYKVLLDDYDVTAEVTASKRVGFHKYTFNQTDTANIIFNLVHGINDKPDSLFLQTDGKSKIWGFRKSLGGLRDFQKLYFVAEFSEPFNRFGIAVGGKIDTQIKKASGKDIKAFFRFNDKKEVLLKVAISKVSVQGAQKNLGEIPGWDFDLAKENARKAWNKELGKIQISVKDSSLYPIFYTALYHSFIMPSLDMDIDGRYRSTNNNIYMAKGFAAYTNFSLWDTFRALHPLLTIINQGKTKDFIKTFIERYEHSGSMPIFELSGNDLLVMIGYHSLPVIADAYAKGIRGFDTKKALEGMKSLANMPFEERNLYRTFGYIPYDYTDQAVSRSLEYSFDDWCVAQVAKGNDEKTYTEFMNRANLYKNLYNKKSGFMHPKDSKRKWIVDFNPLSYTRKYTQGNAWQYSTFVLQDIPRLVQLMGGDKKFEKWMDDYFSIKDSGTYQGKTSSLMIGQYYHGNEPSHHAAYLYNYVGAAWKTQQMVRQIMLSQYANTPNGLAGNDDAGQMSAWYVLSAMGFYPVTPGMDYYVIGAPLVDEATIKLENGRAFKIMAQNNNPENKYIQSATLNGKPYTKSYLKHEDIMKGGSLVFEMGNKPNKDWAQKKDDRPYLFDFEDVAMPQIFVAKKQIGRDGVVTFNDSCIISVTSAMDKVKTYYTTDGSIPDSSSKKYDGEFNISESCTLKVRAFKTGYKPSYTASLKLRKLNPLPQVELKNLQSGVLYEYREVWICKKTAQIDQYPILKKGTVAKITSDIGFKTASNYGMVYTGYLKIPKSATYTFFADTEYAAALWIDDILIASNESTDWLGERSGRIALQKGFHKIKVKYFQVGGQTELKIWWQSPDTQKTEIPEYAYFHEAIN